jgi:hypothetical protein
VNISSYVFYYCIHRILDVDLGVEGGGRVGYCAKFGDAFNLTALLASLNIPSVVFSNFNLPDFPSASLLVFYLNIRILDSRPALSNRCA